ncbi:MAG: DNA (cytosine-5-)-methyltransferase [Armatimonadetes bacterium]|nr:DNA (cytosine-5-)-methyltransferase [Armatimonadota bacterium]
MPSVIDLFCGIGGLTHGFVKEGFDVIAGIDVDASCKYAYEENNKAEFILEDVHEFTAEDVNALYPKDDLKILVGCAPCQPFSRYTNRKTEDKKWQLVGAFAKLISEAQPDIVSMENVPELAKHSVFQDFLHTLDTLGYKKSWSLVECVDYGIPQTRTRLVLFASKLGPIEIIKPTHSRSKWRTVRQVIRNLEPLSAGEFSKKDPIHCASALTELNMRRIMATPEGGSWKDWDEELILDCHKKETGKSYPSVYGRMKWDDPAPTMTTQCNGLGNGRYGHPEQNRAISLREAALIQTFPKSYRFIEPGKKVVIKHLARHIGNAVPVRLGQIIAKSIKKHLETYNGML